MKQELDTVKPNRTKPDSKVKYQNSCYTHTHTHMDVRNLLEANTSEESLMNSVQKLNRN